MLAYRDPRTPWYARAFAAYVVARTLSPIDLIPDFIPVLGLLDDVILTPLGIMIAVRLIPPQVLAEARLEVQKMMLEKPAGHWYDALPVVLIWLVLLGLAAAYVWKIFAVVQ